MWGRESDRRAIRCTECGQVWVHPVALDLMRESGRCLVCSGESLTAYKRPPARFEREDGAEHQTPSA